MADVQQVAFSLRLPPAKEAQIRAAAVRHGLTPTGLLRQAVDEWLDRHDTAKDPGDQP